MWFLLGGLRTNSQKSTFQEMSSNFQWFFGAHTISRIEWWIWWKPFGSQCHRTNIIYFSNPSDWSDPSINSAKIRKPSIDFGQILRQIALRVRPNTHRMDIQIFRKGSELDGRKCLKMAQSQNHFCLLHNPSASCVVLKLRPFGFACTIDTFSMRRRHQLKVNLHRKSCKSTHKLLCQPIGSIATEQHFFKQK